MKSMLNAPGTKRLKLLYNQQHSSFAFNFNLRRYTTGTPQYNLGMKALPRHIADNLDDEAPDAADTLCAVRAELEGVVQCGVTPQQTQRLEATRERARPFMPAMAASGGGSGGDSAGVSVGLVVGGQAASFCSPRHSPHVKPSFLELMLMTWRA